MARNDCRGKVLLDHVCGFTGGNRAGFGLTHNTLQGWQGVVTKKGLHHNYWQVEQAWLGGKRKIVVIDRRNTIGIEIHRGKVADD